METQNQAILEHLESGKSITPIDALRKFGSMRLGARIYDLKQMGHTIEKRMVSNGEKRFASYRMAP